MYNSYLALLLLGRQGTSDKAHTILHLAFRSHFTTPHHTSHYTSRHLALHFTTPHTTPNHTSHYTSPHLTQHLTTLHTTLHHTSPYIHLTSPHITSQITPYHTTVTTPCHTTEQPMLTCFSRDQEQKHNKLHFHCHCKTFAPPHKEQVSYRHC